MAQTRRYYHEGDRKGVTPFQFHELTTVEKSLYVLDWIIKYFEFTSTGRRTASKDIIPLLDQSVPGSRRRRKRGKEIPLRNAIATFPERIIVREAMEIEARLHNAFRTSFTIHELGVLSFTTMMITKREYQNNVISEGVRTFKWLDPSTLSRMRLPRLIGYLELWSHVHFDREEYYLPNLPALETRRTPLHERSKGAYTTGEVVKVFPYNLGRFEQEEVIKELSLPALESRVGETVEVFWKAKDSKAFKEAGTRYSNWHKYLLDQPDDIDTRKPIQVEKILTRAGLTSERRKRSIKANRKEISENITVIINLLAPLHNETGHNSYASGESREPEHQALYRLEEIKKEVEKDDPDDKKIKDQAGLFRRFWNMLVPGFAKTRDKAFEKAGERISNAVGDAIAGGTLPDKVQLAAPWVKRLWELLPWT